MGVLSPRRKGHSGLHWFAPRGSHFLLSVNGRLWDTSRFTPLPLPGLGYAWTWEIRGFGGWKRSLVQEEYSVISQYGLQSGARAQEGASSFPFQVRRKDSSSDSQ